LFTLSAITAFSAMPKWGRSVSASAPNGQSNVSILPDAADAKDIFMSLISFPSIE
jgi:hypothetical protein